MIDLSQLALFAAAALLLAITPGPNMIYLVSRALCQGRSAGVLSWLGVVAGLLVHMTAASVGLSALFMAVPLGYEVLRVGGALYLGWLAWQALKPGAASPFEARDLPRESPRRLFTMGLLTSVLNPKIAIFYLSVLPQFIRPDAGGVLAQSLVLGVTQICIGALVNLGLLWSAAAVSRWFARNRLWMGVQQRVMGCVLAALAVRLLLQPRPAT